MLRLQTCNGEIRKLFHQHALEKSLAALAILLQVNQFAVQDLISDPKAMLIQRTWVAAVEGLPFQITARTQKNDKMIQKKLDETIQTGHSAPLPVSSGRPSPFLTPGTI